MNETGPDAAAVGPAERAVGQATRASVDLRSETLASAQHRLLFEQSPDAILVARADGFLADANPEALRLLGYEREALLSLHLEDIGTPGPGWTGETYARFVERRAYWEGEAELRTSTGAMIPVEARAHVVHGEGQTLTIFVFRDLSERKENEVTRARLAALVRSSADAIVGETLAGIVTDWNPAAERLYGYRADEVVGGPLTALIQPELMPETRDILTRARRGMSVEGFETTRITKDGRQIDISLTVSPVCNDANQVIATSAVVRDITERKATERALAASEERFRVAFENAPVGMVLSAPDGTVLQVNRAICTMLGCSEAELLGRTLRDVTAPEDISANQALLQRAQAGEIDRFELEKRYIRRDGGVVWAILSVSLVRDGAGEPDYFIAQIQDITERKTAEATLAAAHRQMRDLLERITDSFCALDREWRFTYINDEAETLLGQPRETLLGRVAWEAFPLAVGTPIYDICQRAMADGPATSVEFHYAPHDAWYEARIYPAAAGLAVFFRDITVTRQLTQELQASEAKYRTLVEHLPAVVYLLANDAQQTRLYFSPNLVELTGFTPEEALAHFRDQHWLSLVHPDDRERVAAADQQHIDKGGLFQVEYRTALKNGGYVWVRDECVPVHDDAGKIVAWQGVLQDITERIAAEEVQARLAAIVESAEVAITSYTPDGTITSWNRGAERLYGYGASEMIGQPMDNILPPDDPVHQYKSIDDLGGKPVQYEARRYRRDGSAIDVAVSLSLIRDGHGAITGLSAIAQDISGRTRAEEELRAALEEAESGVRTKTLFLAMMSHELRTPLQAVLGYAELLLDGPADSLSREQREDIGYIRQGAGRMVALIEQMLDLSRMEAGRLELAVEPVDLRKVLESVRQDIAPQASAKALTLDIDIPDNIPLVLGDPERVRQILLNLAGNAVKFTEIGGVRISARPARGEVRIAVRDTGIGIPAASHLAIFEEFRQVDANLTRRHGGAGLGLAISKRLAERMGGRVTVRSAPRKGSTFTLHLPKAAGHRGTGRFRQR